MSLRKDVEREVKLREFYRSVEQLLTPEDKDYLFYALKEYNTYKSVAKLMLALNSCLDTPEKLDLLPYIRELMPRHDQKKFDSLAPYNRMAHAPKFITARGIPGNSTSAAFTKNAVRTVTMQRPAGTSLGFSIRGGREHELGIYISHVDSLSLAEKNGLFPGDQILIVNGVSFENITHKSAVLVLKSHNDLEMSVKSVGMIPGKKLSKNSYIWVDASGNPVEEGGSGVVSPQMDAENRAAGDRLLTSPDRRKVVLHADKKRSLGFCIRGGSEYSLGVYVSVVDSGSLAEECGLQVGDQILDVNGHDFLNILHEEAVTIFRSYSSLIITIKSVGRLPVLPNDVQREDETTEGETTEASRAESKTGTLKSSMRKSPPKHHKTQYHSDMALHKKGDEKPMQHRQATVKKSSSFNIATRPKSTHGYTDSHALRPRASSTGSSTLPRMKRTNKPVGVSPLATSGVKATNLQTQHSPTKPREGHRHTREVTFNSLPRSRGSSMQGPPKATAPRSPTGTQYAHADERKFFEYGMGTQLMMASTSSRAKQLLLDRARRLLDDSDIEALKDQLKMYEQTKNIRDFISFLINVLNTPEKIQLLQEVRSVLYPSDLVEFDELVSPHEVAALHERAVYEGPNDEVTNNYNMVLSSIQSGDGQRSLHRSSKERIHKHSPPDLGAFGASAAQSVLHKASSDVPDLTGVQTKESFLAWYDDYDSNRRREDQTGILHQPSMASSNAVIVKLPKNAPFIGLTIQGGVDTPTPGIIIREVKEGGAAHKEGFLKPGFEIVEADGISLRGRAHDEAAKILASAFNSDNPTLELIVIPN